MDNKVKCSGFTLAEVMITLVIVGVVTAIAIMVLINNQKDAELKSRFRKTFSVMSQSINKTNMIDFSGSASCYYPVNNDKQQDGDTARQDCIEFFKTFAKNMNVIKTCDRNAKEEGCVPDYHSYLSVSGCYYFTQESINNRDVVYVLADGQIIILYGNYNTQPYPLFAIDINGKKGPNKGGYDLFTFKIHKRNSDGTLYLSPDGCSHVEAGGRSATAMMLHTFVGKE